MRLSAVVLAEFAQVRDNMLFLLSGGITRFAIERFPRPVNAFMAMVIEIPPAEGVEPFEVLVTVEETDGGILMKAVLAVQAFAGGDLSPGESLQFPLTVPLHHAQLPGPGRYCVRVSIPEFEVGDTLGFEAFEKPSTS